ncbi:MAG: outer membrane protein assembly factor BamE [Alphaproteobacteria bacterium]|nr:outer membrane protein assembly factor BamE [Alphaproteobacteria bacterium]
MRMSRFSADVARGSIRAVAVAVGMAVSMSLLSCSPRIHKQGSEIDAERLAKVETGKTNRDQVLEILGSPSNSSTFGSEVWFYISQEVHATLFFRPEVHDRKVIAVAFDEGGVVSGIETFGIEDGRVVRPVDRVTPTTGHELTIFEQVLGNFGRFSKKHKSQPGGGLPPKS